MTQVVLIFEKSWKNVKMIIIDTGWWNMGIYYTVLTKYVCDWNFHNKMFKIFKKLLNNTLIWFVCFFKETYNIAFLFVGCQ